jgi:hypothetical protein
MSRTNSDRRFDGANDSADDYDKIVNAIIVEEESLVRRMLREAENDSCDRCLYPLRAIAGIVVFYQTTANQLTHLGKSEWALCSSCLSNLKEIGSPRLIYLADEN